MKAMQKPRARAHERWAAKYGPWAMVTGASSGIGRAITVELAGRGMNLVLVARRTSILEELGRELQKRYGSEVRVLAADLTLPKVRADVLSATEAMDIGLIVPAAGFGSSGRFENASKSRERTMLELNCAAVLDLLFGFVPRLVGRGRGGIILWSSITAFQGVPNAAGYAATKAWNQSLAEALHLELKRHGIDVLASAPATVATGFAAEAGLQMAAAARPEVVARKTLSALGKRMTVRPGFLASFLEIALKLPRPLRARIMAKVMGGMAAKTPGPDLRSAGRV